VRISSIAARTPAAAGPAVGTPNCTPSVFGTDTMMPDDGSRRISRVVTS
jgi:hypothetical protein